MYDINYPVAFLGGLVSFFAPCVIPLIPAYIGYIAGVSLKDLTAHGYKTFRKKLLFSSLFYVLGFSIVFVLLGTAASGIGISLRRWDYLIRMVGGFLIVLFGLEFGGFINIPFLAKTYKFTLPSWVNKLGYLRSFFIGFIFAMTWTPCIGAILGSILALATGEGTLIRGAGLLFVYSLGISIPFLLVSLTLASAPKYLSFINSKKEVISKISGIILVFLGLLLLTGTYKYLNAWIFEIAFRWGYQIR